MTQDRREFVVGGAMAAAAALGLGGCVMEESGNYQASRLQTPPATVDSDKLYTVFGIDTSGTMADKVDGSRKIDSAKQELIGLLQRMQTSDKETRADVLYMPDGKVAEVIPGEQSFSDLERAVQALEPSGRTPLGTQLEQAYNLYCQQGSKGYISYC